MSPNDWLILGRYSPHTHDPTTEQSGNSFLSPPQAKTQTTNQDIQKQHNEVPELGKRGVQL